MQLIVKTFVNLIINYKPMSARRYLLLMITLLLFTVAGTGCKLDAPIYPDNKTPVTEQPVQEVDDGTDPPTDATYTIPIGAKNTITFKVDDDAVVVLSPAKADVSAPNAQASNGYTSLLADQADPEIFFQLNFSSLRSDEIKDDLLGLYYKGLTLSDDGGGKVKPTTYKKIGNSYHIRGYFKVPVTSDLDGSLHMVIGSFNIEQ